MLPGGIATKQSDWIHRAKLKERRYLGGEVDSDVFHKAVYWGSQGHAGSGMDMSIKGLGVIRSHSYYQIAGSIHIDLRVDDTTPFSCK